MWCDCFLFHWQECETFAEHIDFDFLILLWYNLFTEHSDSNFDENVNDQAEDLKQSGRFSSQDWIWCRIRVCACVVVKCLTSRYCNLRTMSITKIHGNCSKNVPYFPISNVELNFLCNCHQSLFVTVAL